MNIYASSSNRPREASSFKLVAAFLLLALCIVTMVPSAWSQESAGSPSGQSTDGGTSSSAGMQAAAGLLTIPYFPCKLAFAIAGGIVGGLTYAFTGGNDQAAKTVWTTSMYGTYILTPDHLQGNRPIRFLGVADADTSASAPEPIR